MTTYPNRWRAGLLVAGLAMLLVGCHTVDPDRRPHADREWAEQTKHGQSELTKRTGSGQEIDWASLPTAAAK